MIAGAVGILHRHPAGNVELPVDGPGDTSVVMMRCGSALAPGVRGRVVAKQARRAGVAPALTRRGGEDVQLAVDGGGGPALAVDGHRGLGKPSVSGHVVDEQGTGRPAFSVQPARYVDLAIDHGGTVGQEPPGRQRGPGGPGDQRAGLGIVGFNCLEGGPAAPSADGVNDAVDAGGYQTVPARRHSNPGGPTVGNLRRTRARGPPSPEGRGPQPSEAGGHWSRRPQPATGE